MPDLDEGEGRQRRGALSAHARPSPRRPPRKGETEGSTDRAGAEDRVLRASKPDDSRWSALAVPDTHMASARRQAGEGVRGRTSSTRQGRPGSIRAALAAVGVAMLYHIWAGPAVETMSTRGMARGGGWGGGGRREGREGKEGRGLGGRRRAPLSFRVQAERGRAGVPGAQIADRERRPATGPAVCRGGVAGQRESATEGYSKRANERYEAEMGVREGGRRRAARARTAMGGAARHGGRPGVWASPDVGAPSRSWPSTVHRLPDHLRAGRVRVAG